MRRSTEQLDDIGEQVLQLIEKVEAKADPAAQQEARARAATRVYRSVLDAP